MPRTRTPKISPSELQLIENFQAEISRLGWLTVRNQIVTQYEQSLHDYFHNRGLSLDEISQKRLKRLSKNDILTLSLCFLARLIELQQTGQDTEDTIDQLCQSETKLLERGYPKATIAKNHHPQYIKLVRHAALTGDLILTEQNSYTISVFNPEREAIEDVRCHYIQLYLKYETNFYLGLNKLTTANNNIKQDNPKPVKLKPYLEKVQYLLHSPSCSELATGIAIVTGRRFSELVLGQFSLPTDSAAGFYQYLFEGQLKKSDTADAFLTYSLIPASVLVDAIARFRSLSEIQSLISKSASPTEINETINSAVNYQVQQHFQRTGIVEVLEKESRVTIHNLRGVYGEIATYFFCANRASFPRFLSFKLGHLIGSDAVNLRNSPSTEHYFHYYLVDEDDRTIHSMGVKLAQSIPNEEELDYFSSDKIESAISDNQRTILQIRLSTKQRFLSFQGNSMNENDTLNSVLDKAELTDELETQLQQASDLATAFRERETALRDRELELQNRIAILEAQLNDLQANEINTPEKMSLSTPGAEASSSDDDKVSSLQNAVQLLVQSQTQLVHKFDLFLERSTNPSFPNHTSPPSYSASTAKVEEHITRDRKHDSSAEDGEQMTNHERLISRAIDQIMAHNNNAKSHEDKWYIGIRPLKDVVNYQPPISKVVKQRKDEIRQHHKLHGINQTHNARFHTGNKYSDFFDFD